MNISVNGKKKLVHPYYSVGECLSEMNLKKMVIVFLNGRKLLMKEYSTTSLNEGDSLTIIKPVGGG